MKLRIQQLQQQLDSETDFEKRLDLSGEIYKLKLEAEGIVIDNNTEIECFGCGS